MAKKAAASQMQSVRVSNFGNVGFLFSLAGLLTTWVISSPSQWMYQGNLTPNFLSLTATIIWAPNHDLPTHPTAIPLEIDVQSDGHSRLSSMLRSQGGRVGTGHRRVHCETRPKHKNRGTVWELEVVFFWRLLYNLQGRKMLFFGRKSGWTFVYIYIDMCV